MSDVLVVGGGVIGLSTAYELSQHGAAVTLIDQSAFGQEASWAGAGMLPPGNADRAAQPAAQLRSRSSELWPGWSAQLQDETSVDNGFRQCGGLQLSFQRNDAQLREELLQWQAEGVPAEVVSGEQIHELEPAVSREIANGIELPGMSQVRNPRHLKALVAACTRRGVQMLPHTAAVRLECRDGFLDAVETTRGRLTARQYCFTSGAWTGQLMAQAGCQLPIEPVRGQIVLLEVQPGLIGHVLEVGKRYLVPRPDGRLLVGSTEERVGFHKGNTAAAVESLLNLACRVVPQLRHANVSKFWSGLRPHVPDGLPVIGRLPSLENVYVAAGHFRSGLQLSPITAVLIRQLILDQPTLCDVGPFAATRFVSQQFDVSRS